MVAVVQLVERQFVVLDVAGSSPVGHPNRAVGGHASAPTLLGSWLLPGRCASSSTAEQRTLNPQVLGSKPRGRTKKYQVRGYFWPKSHATTEEPSHINPPNVALDPSRSIRVQLRFM